MAVGLALGAASLSACTSTGNGVAPELALNTAPAEDEQSADFPLPETVVALPSSYAPAQGAPVPVVAQVETATGSLPVPAKPAAAQPAATQVASLEPMMPASAYAAPDAGPPAPAEIEPLIQKYAAIYDVPADFLRRVVKRESTFNPSAYNRGHWGLMQIKHATARGMGYDGPAKGLLDAETNLKYAVKYLRGALLVAEGDTERADKLYQRGYYYEAKRAGLLTETGLGTDRHRMRRRNGEPALDPRLAAIPVAMRLDFPAVAEGTQSATQADFPPAPAAPGATPAMATPVAAPPAAASADTPAITPATAPVPTSAPTAGAV